MSDEDSPQANRRASDHPDPNPVGLRPLHVAHLDDSTWIQVAGSTADVRSLELKSTLLTHIDKGARNVFVDFHGCEKVDLYGLEALVTAYRRLQLSGGQRFVLQNLNASLETLFERTKLDLLFDVVRHRDFGPKSQVIVPAFEAVSCELMEYFASNPDRLHDMNWRDFEMLLDAVFRNQGYTSQLGPGRADGGIDIRLLSVDPFGELLTLVQVKKYHPNHPIRLEAVQALCAVVDDEKANRGLFVTTSRYLPSVRKFAERQRHKVALADSSDVARWCDAATRQWKF